MAQITKNRKKVEGLVDKKKSYTLGEASKLVKDITYTKFDSSVDLCIRLGVDPRKANQMVRGIVTLPHGTGKVKKVLVLCSPDKEEEAKAAGADFVGLDEYIEKIKGGWTGVDVIITTPTAMGKVGALGKILGPRGLMPNPKTGTVTMEVGKAVAEVKAGKIDFKVAELKIDPDRWIVSQTSKIVGAHVDPLLNSISVYPNPFTKSFSVLLPSGHDLIDLQLISPEGNLIKQYSGNNTNITWPDISPGFYILRVKSNTGITDLKIVKQ